MADASKLKGLRRSGLGAPPSVDEARMDLAPLSAPDIQLTSQISQPTLGTTTVVQTSSSMLSEQGGRLDGRTMRRSGRTVQFATRVSPEFDRRVRQIALRDGLLLVEVLERALDVYESKKEGLNAQASSSKLDTR